MTFLHTLKPEERRILRQVVKRVHLKDHPEEICTDLENDKVIAVIGKNTIEKILKVNIDRIQRVLTV